MVMDSFGIFGVVFFRWVAGSEVNFSGIFIFSDAEGTRVSIVVGIWGSFNRKYGDR